MKKIQIPNLHIDTPVTLPGFQIIRYVDDFNTVVIIEDEYTPDEAVLFFTHPAKSVTIWKVAQDENGVLYIWL
jgi:hypothetical protein